MVRTRYPLLRLGAPLVILSAVPLAAAMAAGGSGPDNVAHHHAAAVFHLDSSVESTGSIEGRVIIRERPRRRVADRYAGAAGGGSREQPRVPVVVHLDGVASGATAGGAEVRRMEQRDTAFVPPLVVVPAGATVVFPNEDPFFHNVFSYSRARRFDLGRFPAGEAKSVDFPSSGYVKVFCEVHQWMRAAILVVDGPFHQVVDEDGRFRIEGVPAGRHTLVVTDFDRGETRADVEVAAGRTARIEIEL